VIPKDKTWTWDEIKARGEALKKKLGRLPIDHQSNWYFSCSPTHVHLYTYDYYYFWNRNGED
jgi:hypothetical protein